MPTTLSRPTCLQVTRSKLSAALPPLPLFLHSVYWDSLPSLYPDSPLFSAGDKNEWRYTATPPICLHGMNRVIIYHITLRVQTDSGSQPATNSTDRRLTKVKADHSPPSTVEVSNLWSYNSTPLCAFMVRFLIQRSGNFTLLETLK
jgi:hypothetical protein